MSKTKEEKKIEEDLKKQQKEADKQAKEEQEEKDKAEKLAEEAKEKVEQEEKDKITKIKAEAIAEYEAAADAKKKVIDDALDEEIKKIQSKKFKTAEDAIFLNRKMKTRAKTNSTKPRDIDKLFPSQMTLEEMTEYCEKNEIECLEGDTTYMLRLRIKAFRNPGQAEKLRALEVDKLAGKTVR